MHERDNKDSCLHAFTGNVSMLPSFDEVLAEIEADIAADSEGCLTHGTSSPSLSTGDCSEGGYRYISRVSNQFAASTLYFDPTTEQLVGITSYGDFGLCGPNTYYISHIECDEMTNQVAICP